MSVRRGRPLTCEEAARAASRDFDGRLSQRERLLLRRHLRACQPCADFVCALQTIRLALRILATVSLPATLRSFNRLRV